MNRELLTRVRDALEDERQIPGNFRFDMSDYFGPDGKCGTAGCIGGLAVLLAFGELDYESLVYKDAQKALDLTYEQAEELFEPDATLPDSFDEHQGACSTYELITAADAAKTITKLLETGEVDWSHAVPKGGE